MPALLRNISGLSYNSTCGSSQCGTGWPPDPNGDVGRNYYIQGVNTAYAIFSKSGGAPLAAFTENSLWSASGTNPCNGDSAGDPIVLYDPLADRWILTHFAFGFDGVGNPKSPFYQCIAVSRTADPVAGGWYLYPIQMDTDAAGQPPAGTLNDYSKFGIWTDCLYMAANGFMMPAGTFNGSLYASFNKADLYAGAPLTWSMGFIFDASDPFTMIPSNLRGTSAGALPPAGTPNYFVSESQTGFAFEVRKFTAGPSCGAGGTLGSPTNVSQASYIAPGTDNVPQPATAIGLDNLGDRILQKVQYRKVGSAESLWVVHSVQTDVGFIAPQWAQIDVTGGTVATNPVQQQIFTPDHTLWRWMGSIAADNQGNVALGYSTSGGASPYFPSIRYVGRLAGDPPGNMSQTERQLVGGVGPQTNSCGGGPCHRWGDYTAMTVDPTDDCTFWYTNQYYSSTANGAAGNWQTRIGSFKFPSCVAIPIQAVSIATQPANQTACAASHASFSSAAAGNPAPSARWQVSTDNGTTFNDIAGATTGTYTFTAQGADSGKLYRAIWTNVDGSATSTAATLAVNTAAAVTTNPGSLAVNPGQTASFTAAASGSPAPTVKWQVSIDGGVTYTDIPGATSTTLSFTATAGQNGNRYRAVFTNGCGIATTTAATLSVASTVTITTQPANQTACVGANASFTSAAIGSETPTVQWQVSTNGGATFSDIPGATAGTLTFATTSSQNGNQYRAVWSNSGGSATSGIALLTVSSGPAITRQPVSRVALVDAQVAFTAAANGSPAPGEQWQMSTDSGTSFNDIAGAITSTLSFTMQATDNGNQYRAVFTNICGVQTTNPATLTMATTTVYLPTIVR
jgi:hypothetical protein